MMYLECLIISVSLSHYFWFFDKDDLDPHLSESFAPFILLFSVTIIYKKK